MENWNIPICWSKKAPSPFRLDSEVLLEGQRAVGVRCYSQGDGTRTGGFKGGKPKQ
jgi:hypothetical protein